MTKFSLLGVLKFKNDGEEYVFKNSLFLATLTHQAMRLYIQRGLSLESRVALFASTIEQWFAEAENTNDNFKIPLKEVCEYV